LSADFFFQEVFSMWNYIWPVLLVVGANTFYHICSKSTPDNVQPFATLVVTYLVSAACCLVLFFVTSPEKNLFAAWKQVNWTAFAFGLCLVGLEFGYIQLYRAGWSVSVGPLVCYIALACVLLVIGVLLYKETLHLTQVLGMLLCVAGLILVNR
jgi:drug/metabolite transporter (DMT)-like permease